MVRAPCCEKMGLKKGPWTRDEDQILINHVTLYGHGNWRALPKQAGLLRCGKSCRLRWTNYLRPDIKRGNFSEEEEETIINLHGVLGNRWSAIAARLPGRTDNEIKNVWHTHLKKKLKKVQEVPLESKPQICKLERNDITSESKFEDHKENSQPNSPQPQSSTTTSSTVTTGEDNNTSNNDEILNNFFEVDDTFWSDVFSVQNSGTASDGFLTDNSGATSDFLAGNSGATSEFNGCDQIQFPFTPLQSTEFGHESNLNMNDAMDFYWYDIFAKSSGELPEF